MALDIKIKKHLPTFDLDIEFTAGAEAIGFLGASGCGKSLTLRCIAGVETPDEGHIIVNGKTFFDSDKKVNLTPQQRKTALLFQIYRSSSRHNRCRYHILYLIQIQCRSQCLRNDLIALRFFGILTDICIFRLNHIFLL